MEGAAQVGEGHTLAQVEGHTIILSVFIQVSRNRAIPDLQRNQKGADICPLLHCVYIFAQVVKFIAWVVRSGKTMYSYHL